MKELRFENLNLPEYYHEIPDFDSRITIRKFLDARDTMGLAKLSLSYIEIAPCSDIERNFAKTIHLRHAIEDLNNSFDLLLQIPWMYYRAWAAFNKNGVLFAKNARNRNEIIRNTDDWVYLAERECNSNKLLAYLNYNGNPLETSIKDFMDEYVGNANKHFTVRTLCNTMKHNHSLSFSELYEPYEFTINVDGTVINLREMNLGTRFKQTFWDKANPTNPLGEVRTCYNTDLEIDIEYYGGELFRYSDCTHESDRHKILDVYNECVAYFDAIVDLFETVYNKIYPDMIPCLSLSMKQSSRQEVEQAKIDLNKYFSLT